MAIPQSWYSSAIIAIVMHRKVFPLTGCKSDHKLSWFQICGLAGLQASGAEGSSSLHASLILLGLAATRRVICFLCLILRCRLRAGGCLGHSPLMVGHQSARTQVQGHKCILALFGPHSLTSHGQSQSYGKIQSWGQGSTLCQP